MGTIAISTIIAKAQITLQDTTGVRWPTLELLGWANEAQREISFYKPNACVRNTSISLSAGTKQTLPADGLMLIDIPRNTSGRAVRLVMREILDAQVPDWHQQTQVSAIKHYTYSPLDPRTFYVYPPAANGLQVDVVYGATPAPMPDANGTIDVDDIYEAVILNYILYRAYLKDTEYAADQSRATAHQRAYLTALTGRIDVEARTDPNVHAPANPNVTPNSR